jgi:hypothetical protein
VRNTIKLAVIVLAGSILGTTCVTSGTFEAKEADLAKALEKKDALKHDNAKLQAYIDDRNRQIAELTKQMDRRGRAPAATTAFPTSAPAALVPAVAAASANPGRSTSATVDPEHPRVFPHDAGHGGVPEGDHRGPTQLENHPGSAPADGGTLPRVKGWGSAAAYATVIHASGACPFEYIPVKVTSSYQVGPDGGGARTKSGSRENGSFVSCEALERDHAALEAVIVHVETAEPIALPLELATAHIVVSGGKKARSLALLFPLTSNSATPWFTPMQTDTLSLNIDPGAPVDVVLLFAKVVPKAYLLMAGRRIPIREDSQRLKVESRSSWEFNAPGFVQQPGRPCLVDAKLQTVGDGYSVRGHVERRDGVDLLFCEGARHEWDGRSEDIQGVFVRIVSSAADPLVFEVTPKGYHYVRGRGLVQLKDGTIVLLAPKR